MRSRARRAAALVTTLVLAGSATACGGGFSAAPSSPPDDSIRSYVALGDGFTAAPYAGQTAGDDGCLRSTTNYPALVADELGIDDVTDVSCTGATTSALTAPTKPQKDRPPVPAQLDSVGKDTDLVSVGMGIEDNGLLHNMFAVCLAEPCTPGTVIYTQVLQDVDRAVQAVTEALRTVQAKAPDAYLVVVGYPTLTPPPEAGCKEFPAQDPRADRDVVNYVLADLNKKLRTAARQAGAAYVDVAALSADHALCSRDPWVHGMTVRGDRAVAYHPVAAEQRAVADQMAAQVEQR